MANFVLQKFRPTRSWINLCCLPVGSHFVGTCGPTTCFLLKINHHLWIMGIKRGSMKIGLHMFSTLWENIISKLCLESLWNTLKIRCWICSKVVHSFIIQFAKKKKKPAYESFGVSILKIKHCVGLSSGGSCDPKRAFRHPWNSKGLQYLSSHPFLKYYFYMKDWK